MSHFTIQCRNCGKDLREVYCAFCEHCKNALLVTKYKDKTFSNTVGRGIWGFNWLPIHHADFNQSGPVVYKSKGLSTHIGLDDLYIAFNGYAPEIGASLETCTFKEFEAAVVLQNALENGMSGLVVASAGNTAKAFSHLSVISGYPVIVVVPTMCLVDMWYLEHSSSILTVAVGDGDYADSIDVARRISLIAGFPFEGGVKNIAKRDGLGLVLLEAVSEMGRLPAHYFQAVGSGTGAVGVWEMAERFVQDGRFGSALPTLHLAQNLPFAPMVYAWNKNSRELFQDDLRPELLSQITTRVLSTRYPAYSVKGGVFDALTATNGRMYGIENKEIFRAMEIFEHTECLDIVPAAGVAVAALMNAADQGNVLRDELILLNITGGGEKRLMEDKKTFAVEPHIISKKISDGEIEDRLCHTLKKNS
ncbi:MAG: cysteate synthase [Nitrospiraceae bacterium]|nr:MAG: cysteate synthase [Nitrospiraceae bacterium]